MHTGRCGNTRGQKCRAKGSRKEVKYKNLCIDIHEMYDYTGHNWSRRISNKRLKKHLEVIPGKHSTYSLNKTDVLGTSHITWEIRQSEI